jgi:hypothetical protein
MRMKSKIYKPLMWALFLIFFLTAIYCYLVIQVLYAEPFRISNAWTHWGFENVFGDFPLNYTQLLEISVVFSFIFLILLGINSFKKNNILCSFGRALALYCGIGAVIIYIETNIFWGKFWHWTNHKFWDGFPGGGGYPWGSERVTNNLALITMPGYSHATPNVYFLNYDELFFICLVFLVVGIILYNHYKKKLVAEKIVKK